MPAKLKKGRAKTKTVNLNDFAGEYIPEDNYDWAQQAPSEQPSQSAYGGGPDASQGRREYSRVANNRLGDGESFRNAPEMKQNEQRDLSNLEPPFVAHFGNLRNGITEDEFRELFNPEAVVTLRLINRDTRTFAFVEFATIKALQVALLLNGTMVKGRNLRVDVATSEQVDRMQHRGGRGGGGERGGGGVSSMFSRDEAGQAQPSFFANHSDFSRDNFGAQQLPEREDLSEGRAAFGRKRGEIRQSVSFNDFSRDMIGSEHQSPVVGGAGPSSGGADFAGWRTDAQVDQPQPPARPVRDSWRDEASFDRSKMRGGNGNVAQPQPPAAAADFTNWRDAPQEPQQQQPVSDRPPSEAHPEGEERGAQRGVPRSGRDRASNENDQNPSGRGRGVGSMAFATNFREEESVAQPPPPAPPGGRTWGDADGAEGGERRQFSPAERRERGGGGPNRERQPPSSDERGSGAGRGGGGGSSGGAPRRNPEGFNRSNFGSPTPQQAPAAGNAGENKWDALRRN